LSPRRHAPSRTGLAHRHVQRRQPHRKTGGPPTHEGLWAGVRRLGAHYTAGGGGRRRLGWPRGRRARGRWRQHGATYSTHPNGIYGTPVGSFWLDAGELDHLGPFLGLIGDELAEIGRRTGEHGATKLGKPRLDLGIGECGVGLPVELVDDG